MSNSSHVTDTNPTRLLNGSGFLNPNVTYILNGLVVLICLSNFIKMKKKKIVLTKLI